MEAHATVREVVLVGLSSGYRCGEMVCQTSLFSPPILEVSKFSFPKRGVFSPTDFAREKKRVYFDFMC